MDSIHGNLYTDSISGSYPRILCMDITHGIQGDNVGTPYAGFVLLFSVFLPSVLFLVSGRN